MVWQAVVWWQGLGARSPAWRYHNPAPSATTPPPPLPPLLPCMPSWPCLPQATSWFPAQASSPPACLGRLPCAWIHITINGPHLQTDPGVGRRLPICWFVNDNRERGEHLLPLRLNSGGVFVRKMSLGPRKGPRQLFPCGAPAHLIRALPMTCTIVANIVRRRMLSLCGRICPHLCITSLVGSPAASWHPETIVFLISWGSSCAYSFQESSLRFLLSAKCILTWQNSSSHGSTAIVFSGHQAVTSAIQWRLLLVLCCGLAYGVSLSWLKC